MGVAPVVSSAPYSSGAHLMPWESGSFSSTSPASSPISTSGINLSSPSNGAGGFTAGAPPDLASLSDLINSINRNAQQASNAGRIPGGAGLEQQSSNNISSELSGQLPNDVIRQLTQSAAERGIATGAPGSDNANSSLLQALGLNSLQLQQQGQQNLTAADARNPGAPIFDPTSMLLTPYQAGQLNNQNALLGLDWYKALHPGYSGGGGGGGGARSAPMEPASQPSSNDSWWNSLFHSGTASSSSSGGGPIQTTYNSGMYPGTSVTGLPDLGSILGPQDPGYGYSPDPAGQQPWGTDLSNQDAWNFNDPSTWDFGGYDPFSTLGG